MNPQAPTSQALPLLTRKLMGIMEELTELMTQEIPMIKDHRYEQHAEMLRRKQELTLDYQATLKSLAESGKDVNEAEKNLLKQKGKELEALARENAAAIQMAHNATERLLQVMMDEVRKDLMKNSGYSQQGHLSMKETDKSQPVACNQSV
jgi:hypothetical protein